ncbi:hypothetical protein ElyMa_006897700 [Elysia marginata]|uniref:Peptidase S1 domain-containing protein n=1 Tax=Elysia marginata TaxID=1093978 RepID=A0AAV4JID6_9GAST|nr:hypothetical protein ElyMa_006897700 [Elysia marginata]
MNKDIFVGFWMLPNKSICFLSYSKIRNNQDAVKSKKADQGNHECEVFGYEPEAEESAYAWDTCSKNPGHPRFIPVPEFCVDHLPKWCADPAIVECVKTMAALTVRLRVSYTSWGRPDGYSFSNHRGSNFLHTGSGWVRNVNAGSGPCQCLECRQSSAPSRTWYGVHLETARHVVYNTEEAQATMVDFFYDDERALVDGWSKTVRATKTSIASRETDTCKVICIIHDQDLADMLQQYLIKTVIMDSYSVCAVFSESRKHLCIIVSHPHGQPKQVTFGAEPLYVTAEDYYRYISYSTHTCPGSSGAPVMAVELVSRPGHKKKFCKNHASLLPPHSRYLQGEGLNQCSGLLGRFRGDSDSYPMRIIFTAPIKV